MNSYNNLLIFVKVPSVVLDQQLRHSLLIQCTSNSGIKLDETCFGDDFVLICLLFMFFGLFLTDKTDMASANDFVSWSCPAFIKSDNLDLRMKDYIGINMPSAILPLR